MTRRIASCSCGALTVACEGEPVRVSVCHCLHCQRRSGSSFAAQARFDEAHVAFAGPWREWVRTNDDGGHARHRFCPDCGSTVAYTLDRDPGVVAIAIGAFADPAFPAPEYSVYEERKHRWVATLGESIDHFD
ncbi:GFA family protein [Sphingomonas abietis]|uniref:GFA family protein n=1 Tax=Sphingomonas abietis TaxID=3012344 RepID=A0ABY7NIV4_9SPHN|nr:GFA family protein [Sphingomonas abietis]WBO21462.1 GFA family protein [Sphingomonas abietis]